MQRVQKQCCEPENAQHAAQAKFTSKSCENERKDAIDNSPVMVAQRKKLQSLFGGAIQRREGDGIVSFSGTMKAGLPLQLLSAIAYNPSYQRPGADGIAAVRHARVAHTNAHRNQAAINSGYPNYAAAPGQCNHHVPYSMVTDEVEAHLSGEPNLTSAVNWLTTRAVPGVPAPAIPNTGTLFAPTYDEGVLNNEVDHLISGAANNTDNLFYWPVTTGDGGGALIDEPWGHGPIPVNNLRNPLRTYQNSLRAQGLIP